MFAVGISDASLAVAGVNCFAAGLYGLRKALVSGLRRSAPKGAFDFEGLAVSLKRYPDTNLEFFRNLFTRAVKPFRAEPGFDPS
jgi:hypothetical protein